MKLELVNITKFYGDRKALGGVNITFQPGIYALMGPNGAGKSTLIRILVNSLRPDEGQILADGQEIHAMGINYQSLIGYVPQQQPLPGYFTAERFLYYIAALKGMRREEAENQIEAALRKTNLWERRGDKISGFSGGMKQRLLIAQAILNEPQMLILDEPTAGLDPKERIRIRNLISEIGVNMIVLIATHLVSDVECIADHILFLKQGLLIDQIRPEELINRLSGRVFEWVVPLSEFSQYTNLPQVSSVTQESDGLRIRMLADDHPSPEAAPVTPHLEDMYLELYGKDA